jgi:hypothetical protein
MLAYEQNRLAQTIRPKLDVERTVECEPVEIIGLGDHQRLIVVEVAVKLDDLRDALSYVRDIFVLSNTYFIAVLGAFLFVMFA